MAYFKYRIHIGETELIAKPLDVQTMASLRSLVEANVVNAKNHKKMFGEEGESAFETAGALFHTSNEELRSIMENPDLYLSVVVVNNSNYVIGFVDTELEDINGFESSIDKHNYLEGLDYKRYEWKDGINAGKAAIKGNMVIDKSNVLADLFYVIIYILFKELIAIGKTICIADIIAITGYTYKGDTHTIDIFNRRSFSAQVLGLEACYVADTLKSVLKKDNELEIEYYDKLLEYDILRGWEICSRVIKKKNILIEKVL